MRDSTLARAALYSASDLRILGFTGQASCQVIFLDLGKKETHLRMGLRLDRLTLFFHLKGGLSGEGGGNLAKEG